MGVRITKKHNSDGSITKRTTITKKTLLGNTKSETSVERIPAKKKGCYIATSVYGSYDCPQVWTLRRYRDERLATNPLGRLFIRIYYMVSPTLVKLCSGKRLFKVFTRKRLDRFIVRLQSEGISDTPYIDR